MLEEDIKSLYDRMAGMDQPPSSISIPGAGRAGRARLTRRRATAVATPMLAAAAVVAIALATSVQGGLHGTQPTGGAQRAPQYFSPLRPYAQFGWLPSSSTPALGLASENTGILGPSEISLGNPMGASLAVYAAGVCHVTGHALNCANFGQAATPEPLGRRVARIDGHPAYWTAPKKVRSPFGGTLHSAGVLAWQYAAGGWAVLGYSARDTAVVIADRIRFGYRGQPAIRFPVQLTDAPANWQVNCLTTGLLGHVMYATSDAVTAGRVQGTVCGDYGSSLYPQNTPTFDAGAASDQGRKNACGAFFPSNTHPQPEVINGYQVVLGTQKTWPNYQLCANDAAGTFVWIAIGAHPTLSPASIFASHLRLLGPNPARWTTKPIVPGRPAAAGRS
jgi:hypothetical protein